VKAGDELSRAQGEDTFRAAGERVMVPLAVACALLLALAFAWPLLRGAIYLDSDLADFYVPVRFFYQRALREGGDFLWFPYEFAGFYLHGEGQAGLYHPLNLLTYRWLPLPLAWDLELLRSYAFALIGAALLLRRFALPVSAALLGGTLYAFSSFQLLHYMHPNVVGATAHLPWLLLALDWMARGESPLTRALAAPLFALLTGSQLLIGHPQAAWMSLCVEGLYTLWLWRGGAKPGFVARAAAAKGLGVACAAIQLLPVWESLQSSTRAAPPANFRESYALQLLDFAQLVQPYLFTERVLDTTTTETSVYVGALGVLALLWLALARRPAGLERRLARAVLALALLGALLALGANGWLYPLQLELPVVGLFRAPARYGFFLNVASALAAALLFADLVRRPRAALGPTERGIAIGLPLLAAAVGVALLCARPEETTGWVAAAAGFAIFAAHGLLFAAAAAGSRGALPALLVLVCLDLGVYTLGYVRQREPEPVSFESFYAATPPRVEPEGFRALEGPIRNTMRGTRYLSGYVAMLPLRELGRHPDAIVESLRGADFLRAVMQVSSVVSDFGDPLPRARLLTQFRVSEKPIDEIAAIDVASTALVAHEIALDAGTPGDVAIVEDAAGDLRLETSAPGRQLLVISESFHEGWRPTIDGEPVEALRVYGDYLGCVVPAGEHAVHWRFEPTSFALGSRITKLALAGVALWIAMALALNRPSARVILPSHST